MEENQNYLGEQRETMGSMRKYGQRAICPHMKMFSHNTVSSTVKCFVVAVALRIFIFMCCVFLLLF